MKDNEGLEDTISYAAQNGVSVTEADSMIARFFDKHPIIFLSLCCVLLFAISVLISHHTLKVY